MFCDLQELGGGDSSARPATRLARLAMTALFSAAYFGCAAASAYLASLPGTVFAFWLPAGLLLAVLLKANRSSWPFYLSAAIVAELAYHLLQGQPAGYAVLLTGGHALEGLAGAWLVRRYVAEQPSLATIREVLGIMAMGAILNTLVGAMAAMYGAMLFLGRTPTWDGFLTYWSSGIAGIFLVVPILLPLSWPVRWSFVPRSRWPSLAGLVAASAIAYLVVFVVAPSSAFTYKFLFLALVLWCSLELGISAGAVAVLFISIVMNHASTHGIGFPLVTAQVDQPYLANLYIMTLAACSLVPAVLYRETERKSRELQQSEQRYRTLVETAREGVIVADPDRRITFVNGRMAEILGYDRAELIGQLTDILMLPADITALEDRVEARKRGEAEIFEQQFVRADGSVIWCIVSAAPVFSEDGAYAGSFGALLDITKRKQAQEELAAANEELTSLNERLRNTLGDLASSNEELSTANKELAAANNYATALNDELTKVIQELERAKEQISALNERHATILAEVPEIIIESDQHGACSWANGEGLAFFGANLAGRPLADLLAEGEQLARGLQGKPDEASAGTYTEGWYVRRDGEKRALAWHHRPVAGREGAQSGMLSTASDITERVRKEQEIAGAREILANDIKAMTKLHDLARQSAEIEDLNLLLDKTVEAAMAICGTDRGNLQLLDPVTGDLRIMAQRGFSQPWLDYWNRVAEGRGACGSTLEESRRVIVEDVMQSPIFASSEAQEVQLAEGVRAVQSTPLISHTGKVLGVFSTHFRQPHRPNDRTLRFLDLLASQSAEVIERFRAGEALRASEERFRAMATTTLDGIFIADRRGIITDANDRYCELTGYSRGEVIGRPVADFEYEEDEATISRRIQRLVAAGQDLFESRHRTKSGEPVYVEISASWVGDENGEMYIFVRDITQRKRAEADLRQAQKMQAIGNLAGGIAHDFNNSLFIILGNAELALSKLPPDSPARLHMESQIKAALRSKNLVQQILAFSRQKKPIQSLFRLEPLITETYAMVRPTIPAFIDLQLKLAECGTMVMADPTSIQQVLMNLCANSVQAIGSQPGRITVGLQPVTVHPTSRLAKQGLKPGEYQLLTVADTGEGIPPENLERIFEPFFTTREVGMGTGMGLAVVHGIVTGMGGSIFIESEPGQGATFSIYLPAQAAAEKIGALAPAGAHAGQGHVMLVDDDPEIVALLTEQLKLLGYRVTACTSSKEAVRIFGEMNGDYSAVITDYAMPGFSGLDLVETVRGIKSRIPVILMSGYGEDIQFVKSSTNLFSAFLQKPSSLHNLSEVLRGVLGN